MFVKMSPLFLLFFILSCGVRESAPQEVQVGLKSGSWRFVLQSPGGRVAV